MLLAVKSKLSFHKEKELFFFFYCWLLGWFISFPLNKFYDSPSPQECSDEWGRRRKWLLAAKSPPLLLYLFI